MSDTFEGPSPASLTEVSKHFLSGRRRPFVSVSGGLGDVARRLYLTTTYEAIAEITEPTFVVCASHNPSALELFRYHANNGNLIILDVGHIFVKLLRDRSIARKDVRRTLLGLCGLRPVDQLAKPREPSPIRTFHAPDAIVGTPDYVVVHPFGRGWGNWPDATIDMVCDCLRALPQGTKAFILCADYISAGGKPKRESLICNLPNVAILRNLSAPAAFSLVASASRFIGNISALAQVAAFERIPSVVLYPERCTDFKPPYNDYSKTIWRSNGLAIPYDGPDPEGVRKCLLEFLRNPTEQPVMRTHFSEFVRVPDF